MPAIDCIQKKANKIIPTEDDIIVSNKNGFGDKIGSTTNLTTSQMSLQSAFSPDSAEYKELEYRVICGQNYQQAAIDRIKGIFSRDMPKTWYVKAANRIKPNDTQEEIAHKNFYNRICSNKKPYFFMYNYTSLKSEYDNYVKNSEFDAFVKFGRTLEELLSTQSLSEEEQAYIENFNKYLPLDDSPGTINRICWAIEREFDDTLPISIEEFDYSILKSGAKYKKVDYDAVLSIYKEYSKQMKDYAKDGDKKLDNYEDRIALIQFFKDKCDALCLDEHVLCDIILDICYTTTKSKQFAWDVCGEIMVSNLLNKTGKTHIPVPDECGDIDFNGEKFSILTINVGGIDE